MLFLIVSPVSPARPLAFIWHWRTESPHMHPVAYAKLRAAYDEPIKGWEKLAEQEVIAKAKAHMLIAIKARKQLEAQRNEQAPA